MGRRTSNPAHFGTKCTGNPEFRRPLICHGSVTSSRERDRDADQTS